MRVYKWTYKKQFEEENVKIDLRREDAFCRLKWSESGHPQLLGILPDFKHWSLPIYIMRKQLILTHNSINTGNRLHLILF